MYSVKGDIGDNWIGYNAKEKTVLTSFDRRWIFDSEPLAKMAIKKAISDGYRNGFRVFRIEEI